MSDTKDLIDILESVKHAFCVGEEVEMFNEIKAIVEDYPKIKAMLNEFISQEVDEYKHMRHEDVRLDETKDLIRKLENAIEDSNWGDVRLHIRTASKILTVLQDYEKSVKITDETLKMLETYKKGVVVK